MPVTVLYESLMELMKEKPISKISIKEICDLSEMSRFTFYLHYQDQFELLADIEKDVLENTEKALGNFDGSLNTKEGIAVFLEYLRENKETFGVLLCQQDSEDFQKKIISKVESNVKASVPDMLAINALIRS
jgi:AcrR family transcriptional regulator